MVIVLFCLSPITVISSAQVYQAVPEDTTDRYQQYSRIYYQIKSQVYSSEAIPKEKYLQFLLHSVNYQVRHREDIPVEALESIDSTEIAKQAYTDLISDYDNPFARKYEIWKTYQDRELYMSIARVLKIKRNILNISSAQEKLDMFHRDLDAAAAAAGRGELEFAIKIFNHLIDFYPYRNVDDIMYFQSELYYQNGYWIHAVDGYRKIIEYYPDSQFVPNALYRLITISYLNLDYQQVEYWYNLYLHHQDKDWAQYENIIYFVSGVGLYQQENYLSASPRLEKIASKSPYYHRSRYLLGECLLRSNRGEEAVEVLKALISQDSKAPKSIRESSIALMGDVLLTLDRYEEAWGYYRLISYRSPMLPHALVGQGIVRYKRGEYELAETFADSIIVYFPHNNYYYQSLSLKAMCRLSLNDEERASAILHKIIEESDNRIWLAKLYIEKLKLIHLLNVLQANDEEFLASGDEELYTDYWKFRLKTGKLLKKAELTSAVRLEPEMSGFIDEKMEVIRLLEELSGLSNMFLEMENFDVDNMDLEDMEILAGFKDLYAKLIDVNSMAVHGGYNVMRKLPYLYAATMEEYNQAAIDSIFEETSDELNSLEKELHSVIFALNIYESPEISVEKARLLKMTEDIRQWREALDKKTSAAVAGMKPLDEVDLTRWSHIAFHKLVIPGEDYTDYNKKQDRIAAIDEYLRKLDNITRMITLSKEQ